MTVSEPGDQHGPGDLLTAGSERSPLRVPRKVVAGGVVGVLVVAGSIAAVRAHQRQQARARASAAAFRVADTVHLALVHGTVLVLGQGRGPAGRAALLLTVQVHEQGLFPDRVGGLSVVATGVTSGRTVGPDLQGVAGSREADVQLTVDCSAVATGRLPDTGSLRLSVVTAAGLTHHLDAPLPVGGLRAAALESCDLPDPVALPTATGDVESGQVSLQVDPVRRALRSLILLRVTGPGLRVTTNLPKLPFRMQPRGGIAFVATVSVIDCVTARRTPLGLTALLQDGPVQRRVPFEPQPAAANAGVSPLPSYLRALVERSCR